MCVTGTTCDLLTQTRPCRAALAFRITPALGMQVHPGKNKQNAVKSTVVTDGEGSVLWCSPARPASCADITHARQLGLVGLLAGGLAGSHDQGVGRRLWSRMNSG